MPAHHTMTRLFTACLVSCSFVLCATVRAADEAPAADPSTLKADNKQLTDELAKAWKEADELKAQLADAKAAAAHAADENADLRRELETNKPPEGTAAELQEKLEASLRSFTLVQDENAQLKSQLDKASTDNSSLTQQLEAARASIASLQTQAAATSQIDPLRSEVRQAQDESARLAAENDELRTRLALQAPSPGSSHPLPTRPSAAAAVVAPTPIAAAPEARTYVVIEGDTLGKIARKFYGSSERWKEILDANPGVVKDEKSLSVGVTLRIP